MSNEPAVVVTRGATAPEGPRRADAQARNPFEVALWVVAAVSIVSSLLLEFLSATTLDNGITNCDANGNCTTSFIMQLAQLGFSVMPNVLAAGILVAAIAIAIRAVDLNARRRADAIVALTSAQDGTSPTATPQQFQPTNANRNATHSGNGFGPTSGPTVILPRQETPVRAPAKPDHAVFMRPPSHG